MSTDCSVHLIFIRLATNYIILNLKIFIWQTIFIWIELTNGFNSQNMMKISYSGKIAPFATIHFYFKVINKA